MSLDRAKRVPASTGVFLTRLVANILGLVALAGLLWFLAGGTLPFITDDRTAFIGLAVITFVMCSFGISSNVEARGWLSPINIAGIALGVVMFLLILGVLAGWQLPLIDSDRTALLVLAALALIKWALAQVPVTAPQSV